MQSMVAAEDESKKRIEVVGAVITHAGKILAARRGPGRPMEGYWEFPGGKVEQGESPREALTRELEEELQVAAMIGDHITTTSHEYDFAIVSLATYFCSIKTPDIKLTEHSECRWLSPDELSTLHWAAADKPTVEILANKS